MIITELKREEFINALETNFTAIKKEKKNTTKIMANYMIDNGFTSLNEASLIKKTKDQLKEICIKSLNPEEEPKGKYISNGSDSLASEIIEVLEELKVEIHKTKINKFIKNRGIKALENLLNKIDDSKSLENLGLIGNGLVLILTLLDTFIDIKTIPKKVKAFREKREAQKAENENIKQ